MRHLKLILSIVFIVIIISGFSLLNPLKEKSYARTDFALSTMVNIKAFGDNSRKAVEAAIERIHEIENTMSAHKEGSDIWRVNNSATGEKVKVSRDTMEVIKKGLFYSQLTGGYFDITIKPLVDLWGIGTDHPRVPEKNEIEEAIKKIGYKNLYIDEEQGTITCLKEGMGIDLGGIAKGYAADEAIRVLKENGIKRAYVDLGGNIFVLGKKKIGWMDYIKSKIQGKGVAREQNWKIGIQDPFGVRGSYVAVIEVSDQTVVTSGPYERNFEENGIIYHHILDPFSGYPASNGLVSATILCDNSIDADALSTSLFLLGEERGLRFIESLEGIEAITINEHKQVRTTKGLEGKVVITNEEYRLN